MTVTAGRINMFFRAHTKIFCCFALLQTNLHNLKVVFLPGIHWVFLKLLLIEHFLVQLCPEMWRSFQLCAVLLQHGTCTGINTHLVHLLLKKHLQLGNASDAILGGIYLLWLQNVRCKLGWHLAFHEVDPFLRAQDFGMIRPGIGDPEYETWETVTEPVVSGEQLVL